MFLLPKESPLEDFEALAAKVSQLKASTINLPPDIQQANKLLDNKHRNPLPDRGFNIKEEAPLFDHKWDTDTKYTVQEVESTPVKVSVSRHKLLNVMNVQRPSRKIIWKS